MLIHPAQALFASEKPFPILPAVDHYCGSEKLMRKAIDIQQGLGPLLDITLDCEDGAPVGHEREHATMCAELAMSSDNRFDRIGARIHDITHPSWHEDLEILIGKAGTRLAFITLPKPRSLADVTEQVRSLREYESRARTCRKIPVHVLIETHGGLKDVWQIATVDGVESLDFGLMDFISAHHGAIPSSAMKSPGQFNHPLVARAKLEIAAAALGNGVVPSHNVSTELSDIDFIRRDAERARLEFGFLRMWSIHPNQIEPILVSMRPDYSEVQTASEILLAAQAAQWGPTKHNGKLHDRASYRYFWELLQRAKATGTPLPKEAQTQFF